jgi:glycosyltransferase involved in cell wall biosynthesis
MFHHYRTPEQRGGLRSWHIGSYLTRNGYKVTAIVPGIDPLSGNMEPGLNGKLWHKETINGAKIIRVNSLKNNRISKLRRLMYYTSYSTLQFLCSCFVKKVDLIISTSMPLSSVFLSFVQAKLRGIPFVIDVRDLPTDSAIELNYFSENGLSKHILNFEAWLFRKADCLIPVSNGMARVLETKGIPPHKIRVVPIGYDGRDAYKGFTDWNRDIRAELGLEGKFIVLYAGTMGHVVDIPTVLEAANNIKDVQDITFVFVGGGQLIEEYKETAKKSGLNCIFLGPRPKSDIPLFCSQADVCVYPLKGSSIIGSLLGNKIFDYSGNYAPTLYSGPEGDIKALIENAGGGICVPAGDAKALSQSILSLYRDPGKKKRLGTNAALYVEKGYKVENMMQKFESIISQIAN